MFLRMVKRKHGSKTYKYAFVVENARAGNKVQQRYVKNLGAIETEEDWKRAEKLFEKMSHGEDILSVKEIEIGRNEEYGNILAVRHFWNNLGCDEIFAKFRKEVFSLVANRLSNPCSENNAIEWIKNDAYIKEKDEIKLHNLYRALDFISENKESFEKKIFENLGIKDLKLVFYDLTSSYFESRSEDELRKFGYSRDKKRGKRQIVIGLILANDLPIAHFVFPGNTVDKDTFVKTIEYLKKLGIKEYVIIADRGLMTEDNIKSVESGKEKYIIATKRRRDKFIKSLMQNETDDAKEVYNDGKKRYILCFSKERKEEDLERLESEIKRFKELLSKDKEKAKKIRENKPMIKRLFDKNLSFNEESYEYEKIIAGKFLLATNTDMSAKECVNSYRQLADIERNFREIKSFVKLRPFYHRNQNRIKAHVFVCVLALLIEKLMEKRLKISGRVALRELKRLRISFCTLNGNEIEIINKVSEKQEEILNSLGIEKPSFVV